MAALTATTPTVAGVASAGAAVASSDTIAASILGQRGAYLEIINGNAGSDTMSISDAGTTAAGNALTGGTFAATVTNGTSKVFHIRPEQRAPSTGLVTVTHSVTATVTYKLYPLG
jgi:tryptophan synthase beta subunit